MELRHLETLLAIAEEGSFTAAADALNTVQSNVSDQIRQLEQELGVSLLVRGRRGAEPTEFGTVVLERPTGAARAEAMHADSDAAGPRAGTPQASSAASVGVAALVADLRVCARRPAPYQRGASTVVGRSDRGSRAGGRHRTRRRSPTRRGTPPRETLVALVHKDAPLPRSPSAFRVEQARSCSLRAQPPSYRARERRGLRDLTLKWWSRSRASA
jgi:DNA-binding transcriptional LysR family regulator